METDYIIKLDIGGKILESVETDSIKAAEQVEFYREHLGEEAVSIEIRTITTLPLDPITFIADIKRRGVRLP